MSLAPVVITKDAAGRWWAEWTPDDTAEGYGWTTDLGVGRTLTPAIAKISLGTRPAGVIPTFLIHPLDVTARPDEVGVYAGAPPPPPPSGIPWAGGATGYEILNQSFAAMQAEVSLWKGCHARYLRTDSTTGNQGAFDQLLGIVKTAGLQMMPVEHGTTGPTTDTSFVKAQATKFKGNPTICAVELGNEPDLNHWTPDQYGLWSFNASKAIHDIDPARVIVVGALWTGQGGAQAFVPAMIAHGVFQYAKVLSMHLYDPPNSRGTWSNWDRALPWQGGTYNGHTARELLDQAGHSDVQIISTESGGPRSKYGETGQASIVHDALGYAKTGKIASCCIYNMKTEVGDFFIDGHAAYGAYQQAAS